MGKYDRFLKPVEEGRKQCTLCDHKFNKQQDSATNLYIHHFSKKHPSEYAHINGKREKSDDVLDQPLVKKMAQATIIESFQNFLPDGVKTEEGHRAITQFLCVTNQSLNMVNCQGFINMIKVISPKLVLKSRTHFTRYEVPKLYEEYERRLMMELRQVENIAISFDGWSDSSNKHECLGVLVHFVKDSKLNFRLIGVIDISHQSHTGIFLFEKIKHNLEHFGIEEKVKVIVRDGARNVVKAADQFRIPHYDCVAHKLHLATKIAIESFPGLLESLEKIRKICSKLNKSSTARREWNELHDLLEIPVLFLKKYTEIRWSSAHAVFERTLKSRDPLKLILLEHDDWPQLTDADWKLMETALEMLQPIAEAVKLVQVNTYKGSV
uniref:BED-type domain-containing protein n=1 Tax=Caenorhabditis japonica TaxID=281687 RepID=A0A8R1DST5_CAEJA